MIDTEKYAKSIIAKYKFSSNTDTGFSCYIPDTNRYDPYGYIIWVYSTYHKRFETHFQNLFSSNRLQVIGQFKSRYPISTRGL